MSRSFTSVRHEDLDLDSVPSLAVPVIWKCGGRWRVSEHAVAADSILSAVGWLFVRFSDLFTSLILVHRGHTYSVGPAQTDSPCACHLACTCMDMGGEEVESCSRWQSEVSRRLRSVTAVVAR